MLPQNSDCCQQIFCDVLFWLRQCWNQEIHALVVVLQRFCYIARILSIEVPR
jgi:hypothetical protein